MLNLFLNQYLDRGRVVFRGYRQKKNEAPPNTRDYMVPLGKSKKERNTKVFFQI